jgi:hypothetical protein
MTGNQAGSASGVETARTLRGGVTRVANWFRRPGERRRAELQAYVDEAVAAGVQVAIVHAQRHAEDAVAAGVEASVEAARRHAEAAVEAGIELATKTTRSHTDAAVAAAIQAAVGEARLHAEAAAEASAEVALSRAEAIVRAAIERSFERAERQAESVVASSWKVQRVEAERRERAARIEVRNEFVALADELTAARGELSTATGDPPAGRRVVLASFVADDVPELLAMTNQNRRAFAGRHGYEVREIPRSDRGRLARSLLDLLAMFDTVVSLDATAFVCDPAAAVAAAPGEAGRPWAMVTHRCGGQRIPSLGVLVVRRTDQVLELLERIESHQPHDEHETRAALLSLLGYNTSPPVQKTTPSPFDAVVGELPQRWNMVPSVGGLSPAVVRLPGFSDRIVSRVLARLTEDPTLAEAVLNDPFAVACAVT